ncbi:glycosyltransferase family 39 protein [Trichocoleus desertorum AS-A10]|uniref:glycosyltransferase family 39 protein n=1 Tax=Trichocoleus desertorum TaxID=1481672 RepID=UPI0032970477
MKSLLSRAQSKKLDFDFYFRVALCILIAAFILLKIISSNHNLYFDRDEVRKLLRTSGFTNQQFIQLTYNAEPINVNKLLGQYQVPCGDCKPKPNLSALTNNLEHPPLYYILLQNWLLGIGYLFNSKLFSTLISIATIPAIYWLAQEIFNNSQISLLSATLFTVSPYLFSMGQHVSQYSLWGALICLSSALFVRATRNNNKLLFTLYTATNLLGLYTHLFFILLIFSHGYYLALNRSWRSLQYYWISLSFSILCFTPWALSILSQREKFEETAGISDESVGTAPNVLGSFMNGTTAVIQTFWKNSNISLLSNDFVQNPLAISIAIFIFATLTYYICLRLSTQKNSLLVLSVLYGTMLPLMLLGTLLGHGLAYKVRYYLPAVIFFIIGISFFIVQQLHHRDQRRRFLGIGLLSLVLLSSCISTSNLFVKVVSNQSSGPQLGAAYELVAPVINQANKPLIISSEEYIKVLMLSHRLKRNAEFLLLSNASSNLVQVIQPKITEYQNSYSEIFIFNPSKNISESLTQAGINSNKFPERWRKPVAYQVLK